MRTFLTYVLAALAATLLKLAVTMVWAIAGDVPLALMLDTLAVTILSNWASFFLLGGALWLIAGKFYARDGQVPSLTVLAPLGIAVALVLMIPETLVAMLRFQELGGIGLPLGNLSILLLAFVFAGLAWGTVFWMRAPKPDNTGIAA